MMSKLLKKALTTLTVCATVMFTGLAAYAAPATNFLPSIRIQGYADATATQTFATTSYADLAAATVSFVPVRDPTVPAGTAKDDLIKITWSADVIKATSTTGTCAVYVNGAVVAASARTIDVAAKQGVIGGTLMVVNSTVGTQTVKLQCKSGDTAVFTVNNAHLIVEGWDQY